MPVLRLVYAGRLRGEHIVVGGVWTGRSIEELFRERRVVRLVMDLRDGKLEGLLAR